jgi:biopolymer transport protein ExbD
MAEIVESGGGGEKGGKKRPKKGSARIDMTPMVDLGFLLLTFFVLTSTFAKPKVMSLTYPAKEDTPGDPPKVKNGITFLVSDDRVFYYKGQFYPAGSPDGPPTQLTETNFGPEGIRKILKENNTFILNKITELNGQLKKKQINDSIYKKKIIEEKGKPDALKVLVKTDMKAKTRNFIDVIDELYIAQIGVIAPVDITKSEQELLDAKLKQ